MDSSNCRILLIVAREDQNHLPFRELLIKSGFEICLAHDAQEALSKIIECTPDLIICHNKLGEKTGLQLYHTLKPELIKRCMPFFLYLPNYQKEDVLIGLEMGVDNFIVFPFDETTVINKIQHQIDKAEKLKFFDTPGFHQSFEKSPVAKFITQNEQILKINSAFSRLVREPVDAEQLPKIEDVFDISYPETNEMNFRKCMNGLKNQCLFQAVRLKQHPVFKFDVHLVYIDYFGEELFMGEVVPVSEINGNNNVHNRAESLNGHPVENMENESVPLTPREKEVLDWSAQGLPIKQIANILHISERTVEKHRANIMSKTNTNSIIEAIYAVQRKKEF
jgi:two-component system alkaline phosphatase synthesis response regulator PhoP